MKQANRRFWVRLAVWGWVSVFSLAATDVRAQSGGPGKLIVDYLGFVVEQNWEETVKLISKESLARRHREYVSAVQNNSSIREEKLMLERLGISSLLELEEMAPDRFYVADRIATHSVNPVTAAAIKRKRETLNIKFLGQGLEDDGNTSHVIVRSRQETLDSVIEELLMVSCSKDSKGVWKIVPDMSRPKVTPIGIPE